MVHSPRFLELVDAAKSRIKEVSPSEVKENLATGAPMFLIDVREDHEWEQGHIPGAVHIGKGILERDIERLIPDIDAEIVLYCGGGYRTALAADVLQTMGYTRVFSMEGGWREWNKLGFPVQLPNHQPKDKT